jgi:hypothetical protein
MVLVSVPMKEKKKNKQLQALKNDGVMLLITSIETQ